MNETLEKIIGTALIAAPIVANLGYGIYRGYTGQGPIPQEEPQIMATGGLVVGGMMSTVGSIPLLEKEQPDRVIPDSIAAFHLGIPSYLLIHAIGYGLGKVAQRIA